MAFTNTGSTAILNGLIGKSSSGPLSSCYLALSSTTPNQDGTNFTELSRGVRKLGNAYSFWAVFGGERWKSHSLRSVIIAYYSCGKLCSAVSCGQFLADVDLTENLA